MFTANTMSSATEAIGMSLPGSASRPALAQSKREECEEAVDALFNLIRKGITPKDILTMKAFENAITVAYALGGSTNMLLHLLAIASSRMTRLIHSRIDLTVCQTAD